MNLPAFRGTRTTSPDASPGTPESQWEQWSALPDFPRALPDFSGGLVVVAAHPEDHVLGVGGLVAAAIGASARVRVVTVSDGDAARPGGPVPRSVLIARRVRETARAVAAIAGDSTGPPPVDMVRLRFAEQEIAERASEITEELSEAVADFGLCVANWRGDGLAAHEATGHIAYEACARTGVPLFEYPLRMWHWALPDDRRVPWDRAVRVDLTQLQQARKERALNSLASVTQPLLPGRDDRVDLPPDEVAYFRRPFEILFHT